AGELDWESDDVHGWYVDFPARERISTKPMLLFDRLIFPTVVPTDSACEFGGRSWIMELTGVGDLYPGHSILENQGTQIETLVSLSDLILGADARGQGTIIAQQSDGELMPIPASAPSGAFGRQSWRQIQ